MANPGKMRVSCATPSDWRVPAVQPYRCRIMSRNVYLGTPVAGGVVSHEYMHSVLAIERHFRKIGWSLTVITQPDGLVTRSRNSFANAVVRGEQYSHLLMLDADVVIAPEAVERMLRSGHDVVGAGVPLRQVDWDNVRELLDVLPDSTADELRSVSHRFAAWFEPAGGARLPQDGFLPARVIGSAALLISRDALVQMVDREVVDAYRFGVHASDGQESGWTFFDPFVNDAGVYLSEDYAFCERWTQAGGNVWVDLESSTKHVGPVAIEGSVSASLDVAAAALREYRARRQQDQE